MTAYSRHTQIQTRQNPITKKHKWTQSPTSDQEVFFEINTLWESKNQLLPMTCTSSHTPGQAPWPGLGGQLKMYPLLVCVLLLYFGTFFCFVGLCLFWFLLWCFCFIWKERKRKKHEVFLGKGSGKDLAGVEGGERRVSKYIT